MTALLNGLRAVAFALTLAVLWLLLAPGALGGTLSVVTIQGTSMQPTLYTGDLVVLSRAPTYAVGDAVAFRSDMAGAVVLHRIIAQEPDTGRYVLIGDNNDFLDRYRPLPEEVVGRMVLRVPFHLAALIRAAVPWLLGLGAALAVALLVQAAGPEPRRRRRPSRTGAA